MKDPEVCDVVVPLEQQDETFISQSIGFSVDSEEVHE
jgi:hypothetical protein